MPENIDLVMAVLFLTGGQLLLEGVLDLLARILEVSLGLVRTSLGLQGLVSGGFTGSLLDLPLGCLRGVLDLVLGTHFCFLPFLPAQPGHKKAPAPCRQASEVRGRQGPEQHIHPTSRSWPGTGR